MPTGIARRGIAGRSGVARRQIACRPDAGGADVGSTYLYPPGSYTFRPPKPGFWKFVLWGPGGCWNDFGDAGGSGAYCEYTRYLDPTQTVAVVVSEYGSATTATFLDSKVVSAGAGVDAGAGGTASGGDVNLNGSTGGLNGAGTGGGAKGTGGSAQAGAGAPANLPFRGGRGSNINHSGPTGGATTPGGSAGAVAGGVNTTNAAGGTGLAIAMFVRA
jgi:hypothetical protein